jgi:osmoprotectant transport system permease protein
MILAGCEARGTVVGAKNFTESGILSEIAAQKILAEGVACQTRELGGTQIAWAALLNGEIDLYPEYSGTLRQEILAGLDLNAADSLDQALFDRGISRGPALGFENKYALGMRRAHAEELGITKASDLRQHQDLGFGFSSEFMDRADGWPGLQARYQLAPAELRGLNHDLAYQGLINGSIDVIDLYTTDAEILRYDLIALDDDLGYFPEYQAFFLYRNDLDSELLAALNELGGRIDEARMIALNVRAKIDRAPEEQVAAEYLRDDFQIEATSRGSSMLVSIARHSAEHLLLVSISLGLAILLGIPAGIYIVRHARPGRLLMGLLSVIQTVPSIALLVFMIPLLGIGSDAAILALFLYSLLPIVRNTCSGIAGIPGSIQDSAIAIGLPAGARLRRIELPMAMPSILAGIKTSAVSNVGTATLGAWIGAGGLGQPIFTGLSRYDIPMILSGAIPAACLAILVSSLFDLLEKRLLPLGLRL